VTRQRVAIVGSGVAGLVSAHVLGPHHDVTVFEADSRLGGHANTVDVDDREAGTIGVDTGFIVHNDRNYPNLVRLFSELGVGTLDTEMSFGVIDRDPASPTSGLAYRATSPNTLFADRRNLARPAMWRMLVDIGRFFRASRKFLDDPDPTLTLADFLRQGGYSRDFVELHLLPMGAAVWSAAPATFDEFPAANLLRFLDNHGLLGVRDRPQWRTIVGGSRSYVEAIAGRFPGRVVLNAPVLSIERTDSPLGAARVVTAHGAEHFDRVVVAAHSDQALRLLARPTSAERSVLGAIGYQANRATLHTDTSLLPPNRRAWAAWNYERRGPDQASATLTYDLTALQRLPGSARYLVSLNSEDAVDPARVLASIEYAHPVFDGPAIAAQARRAEISGAGPIHYCGAYWGYGFHEDGASSALAVCRELGVVWPGNEVSRRTIDVGPSTGTDDDARDTDSDTLGGSHPFDVVPA
jgi:predicted NAD/FAD-binding protein